MITEELDLRGAKKKFLEDFVKILPNLIKKTKKKMIAQGRKKLNLESIDHPEDYHVHLELWPRGKKQGRLNFVRGCSEAEHIDKNLTHIHDYVGTYPKTENHYFDAFVTGFWYSELGGRFDKAYNMCQCLTHFLFKDEK